ncbi:hypothetical protein F5887DRAFT_1175117 [Amanita rubescens]|nr:hypothetical protein F5887DRAFT_1175117 [Amanita rubescens]
MFVDEVFPEKRYMVAVNNVWYMLTKSKLESWHNGFGTMGLKAVESHIDANRKGLPTKELMAGEISAHLVKAPIMITLEHTYYTYYYQWSEWSEDPVLRKGLGRNQLILYTFANAHLVHLNDIDSLVNSRPIGALLLSMQAVERALEYWKEGERAKKDLPEFSKNNFGDTFTKAEKNAKRIRRATIFVKTLERLTDAEWTSLIEEAREWLDDNRRARATSASPNTTHIRKCSTGFCHGSLMPNGHSSHPAACSVAEFTNETIVSSSFACNPRSAVYSLQGCFQGLKGLGLLLERDLPAFDTAKPVFLLRAAFSDARYKIRETSLTHRTRHTLAPRDIPCAQKGVRRVQTTYTSPSCHWS